MTPKTFSIQTLGCKVNQYEAEQMASLLRSRGLCLAADPREADLRIVHTCSVTVQAAAKSRQLVRRLSGTGVSLPVLSPTDAGSLPADTNAPRGSKTIVSGCWATSDPAAATALPGVDAVLTHHDDVAAGLDRLLNQWQQPQHVRENKPIEQADIRDGTLERSNLPTGSSSEHPTLLHGKETNSVRTTIDREPRQVDHTHLSVTPKENNGWINSEGTPADRRTETSKSRPGDGVNYKIARSANATGTSHLPLLDQRQTGRQRAVMKIQDGCDAHCTYCIIPRLRPGLWSKPVDDAVEEARRLVGSGHVEIVLTGIFLGAFGQQTALRRRQTEGRSPLASLIDALCTRVAGLRRLRLSSLEPGDLSDELLGVLKSHEQVVPHFHLPLQSGSDRLLRRMNRQYGRDDFLRMIDQVHAAFDRAALTTDIICGFPGEDDEAFAETLDVVHRSGFIHVHAFSFSPRPGTAAARWTREFVRGPVVNQRIEILNSLAERNSLAFRQSFLGQTVTVLVEREKPQANEPAGMHHGRCERYFPVFFEAPDATPGDFLSVRIDRVTPTATFGTCLERLP